MLLISILCLININKNPIVEVIIPRNEDIVE